MAESQGTKNYYTFVGGLNTEASPLTYPENASQAEDNFDLHRDGSRSRRLGIDYEGNYALSSTIPNTQFEDNAIVVHEWTTVGGDGNVNLAVIQIGSTLYFHDLNQDSISANAKAFTIDLMTYKAPTSTSVGVSQISIASGTGKLFIVSNEIEPIYVTYDATLDTISVTQISIDIRDFDGVSDGLTVETRPATLSDEHNYNLLNQGWTSDNITAYAASKSVYPSNADIWIYGKKSDSTFDPNLIDLAFFGNTPAPKGHYVLDAFNKDRATVSGLTLPTETEDARPTTVGFFAGRVWYAGIGNSDLSSSIFFSQLLNTDLGNVGFCYQDGDPTSEFSPDLLATDGGVITVPEIGTIRRIVPHGTSLIVFADNGVWEIMGGDETAHFTALSHSVRKITSVGALNTTSIVSVENSIFFWSASGMYVLMPDKVSGLLTDENISINTIQSLYSEISEVGKLYSVGTYDDDSKKIYWLYNDSDTYLGSTQKQKYNRVLILDASLRSFYTYTLGELSTYSPYVCSPILSSKIKAAEDVRDVVVGSSDVVAGSDDVVVTQDYQTSGTFKIKFLTAKPQNDGINYKYTISDLSDFTFYDWITADSTGTSYSSYLQTGFEILEDASVKKRAPIVHMFFNGTETNAIVDGAGEVTLERASSCLLQAKWDWTDHSNANKWSTQRQAYRLPRNYIHSATSSTIDDGYPVVVSRNKIRGRGRAVQLRMESEAGKDMWILGWSVKYLGTSST